MRSAGLIALLAVMLTPVVSHAQETADPAAEDPQAAEARALFMRGRDLAHERRFSEAADAFTRSLALVDRASTRFNLAVCHYAQGRFVEAVEQLEVYLNTADRDAEGESWDDALGMITHARQSIAEVVVEVTPEDATITLDGSAIDGGARRTVRVNPGPHVLRAEARNHATQITTLEATPGETLIRALTLERVEASAQLRLVADGAVRLDGELTDAREIDLTPGAHVLQVDTPLAEPESDDTLLWLSLGGGAAAVVLAVVITATIASMGPSEEGSLVIRQASSGPSISMP